MIEGDTAPLLVGGLSAVFVGVTPIRVLTERAGCPQVQILDLPVYERRCSGKKTERDVARVLDFELTKRSKTGRMT